jgi:hypothetical protein
MSMEIKISDNEFAIVDDDLYPALSQMRWHLHKTKSTNYAEFIIQKNNNVYRMYLHRYIMDPPEGFIIDHINGNGLDCRKVNMRICTRKENCWNSTITKKSLTGYKGVSYGDNCIRASIRYGKCIHIGCFKTLRDAALAYDKKAVELFGEYAKTNKKLGLL